MKRRSFLKLSGTTAMAIAIAPSLITQKLYAENGNLFQTFEKVQLKDAEGNALKVSTLITEENYIFNYPHAATPAIMVNLATPTEKDIKLKAEDGTEYLYSGGAGSKGTLVAYSAICPHQLTYPQKSMSMFQYVNEKGKTLAYDKGGVFVCSSHLSAFEPKQGGKVVGGPANQGLASIILEIDKDDNIWAVAVLGPVKFQEFFDAFKQDLKAEYGRRGAKKLVQTEAKVQILKNFSAELIQA
ncbi:Ubiquinol-cytochrome C reductase iron-sulfur subunit [hydrothermal vent metagenome]|uniref:Ubiquinol-cytochrome C reductase iron-sulfur subunit n=1 Tax=hydrothermal vent metagenome TaxID=652676 RepID=A0A1W1ECX5_9ZZZZ